MKNKQRLILCTSGESFDTTLNRVLDDGAHVVPGTIAIQETGSGRQWFSCVVEYEIAPVSRYPPEEEKKRMTFYGEEIDASESFPDLDDGDPEDEAGKLASIEKLMMGLAAAANSEYVQLEHNYHTGDWWVSIGDMKAVQQVSGLKRSPYLALAAAIKHVTKDVL